MIPNHQQFLEAIQTTRKVWVRFYSQADSGMIDRVCAPLDYGLGGESEDELNRYWFWDYENPNHHTLGLVPQQIVKMHVLGEMFDPSQLEFGSRPWTITREWQIHP